MSERVKLSDHFTAGKIFRSVLGPIGMVLFSSFYTIADGIFLSQKGGTGAFSGANLIFPLLMIFGSFGFMFGSGGSALVSKTLGEKDPERANHYFSLIVYTAFLSGILLATIV